MKGIKVEPEIDLQIDLNVTSYIPDEYIQDANQKIEIYQNIALCKNEQDIQNIIDEIIDRFGNMPKELENLIAIARIKYLAKQLKLTKIASNKTAVVFTFEPNKFELDLNELVKKYGNKIKFSAGIKPMITLQIRSENERQILNDVTEFLTFLGLSGTGTE
jgi:transcription-repair coupling factor (superfamily II helicase)